MTALKDLAIQVLNDAHRAFRTPLKWKMHPSTLVQLRMSDEQNLMGSPHAEPQTLLAIAIETVDSIDPGKLALLCREDI